MTKSDGPEKGGKSAARAAPGRSGAEDRRARAARALRENLKKRKQQIKAREKAPD